jgi:hypothetical protein
LTKLSLNLNFAPFNAVLCLIALAVPFSNTAQLLLPSYFSTANKLKHSKYINFKSFTAPSSITLLIALVICSFDVRIVNPFVYSTKKVDLLTSRKLSTTVCITPGASPVMAWIFKVITLLMLFIPYSSPLFLKLAVGRRDSVSVRLFEGSKVRCSRWV